MGNEIPEAEHRRLKRGLVIGIGLTALGVEVVGLATHNLGLIIGGVAIGLPAEIIVRQEMDRQDQYRRETDI